MNTRMVLETDYFGGPMSTMEEGAHAVEYLATSLEQISFKRSSRSPRTTMHFIRPSLIVC
jgi:hypothetical protein